MEKKNFNSIEKILKEDAENIEIDYEFKENLKQSILKRAKEEQKKEHTNIKYFKHLKVASVIAALAITSTLAVFIGDKNTGEIFYKNTASNKLNTESTAPVKNIDETKVPSIAKKDNTVNLPVNIESKGDNSINVKPQESEQKQSDSSNNKVESVKTDNKTVETIQKPEIIGAGVKVSEGSNSNANTLTNGEVNKSEETAAAPAEKVETPKNTEEQKNPQTKQEQTETISGDYSILSNGSLLLPVSSVSILEGNDDFLSSIVQDMDKNLQEEKPADKNVIVRQGGLIIDNLSNQSFTIFCTAKEEDNVKEFNLWKNRIFAQESKYSSKKVVYNKEKKLLYLIVLNKDTNKHQVIQYVLK